MISKKQDNPDLLSMIPVHGMNDHMASLRYAGMIQHALMPDLQLLKEFVKDYFVLLLPRDIVSGDFYYALCTRDKLCIAAGDCTGHGVPGAMMSILGISFLNELLQGGINMNANRILNLMREKVMKALGQTGNRAETKDSIDIGLCVIDNITRKMQFSGANRPLIMIRNGELTEYKPDRMTLGIAPVRETPFRNNIIDTLPGDSFYLFSDGFADQFGEITDKKFRYKQFKGILESIQGLPMNKQMEHLQDTFLKWKGDMQQIDDVLVFGFQL